MRSKKRSAASSKSAKPPDPSVFFLDRSLGKKVVARALIGAGARVEVHDDHFPADARDAQWLSVIGQRGWIVLTKDRRIRYRTPEVAAFVGAGARAFVLTAGDLQGPEMAGVFVHALPAMVRFANRHSPPFIARVTRGGSVSMIVSARGLRLRTPVADASGLARGPSLP